MLGKYLHHVWVLERYTQRIMCLKCNAKLVMCGRGMAARYSQGLCFIPGAKVGPVRVIETFIIEKFHVLLDWVWGGGGGGKKQ